MRKPTQHELYLASQNGGKLPESYTSELTDEEVNKSESTGDKSEMTNEIKKPNSTSKKSHLKAWLDQEEIEYDDGDTNDELYKLVKQNS